MVRLSVNINKVATLRNARGANVPDLIQTAKDCQSFGADGITVHPRPDERHIRYQDVVDLRPAVHTEFNIEGYPTQSFVDLVLKNKPEQVTLVPDPPDAITSNAGWNTIENAGMLKEAIREFKNAGIRTSVFIETDAKMIEGAAQIGADRIELYTESYAEGYDHDRDQAVKPFITAAEIATKNNLGINAGHDLNRDNLKYFAENIPQLLEVSIGHALISDALYLGLENTIRMYLSALK